MYEVMLLFSYLCMLSSHAGEEYSRRGKIAYTFQKPAIISLVLSLLPSHHYIVGIMELSGAHEYVFKIKR